MDLKYTATTLPPQYLHTTHHQENQMLCFAFWIPYLLTINTLEEKVEELHHENGNENNDLIKGNHAKLASLRPHKHNILITGTVITLTSFWPHNTLMTGNLIIITSFWPHKKTARNSLPYNGKSRHANVAFTKDGTKELHYNRTSHHIKLALTSQKTARRELPYNGTSHHTNITSDGTDLAPL